MQSNACDFEELVVECELSERARQKMHSLHTQAGLDVRNLLQDVSLEVSLPFGALETGCSI